jgi:hypothetical protein
VQEEGKELWEVLIHGFDLPLICFFVLQIVIGPDELFSLFQKWSLIHCLICFRIIFCLFSFTCRYLTEEVCWISMIYIPVFVPYLVVT